MRNEFMGLLLLGALAGCSATSATSSSTPAKVIADAGYLVAVPPTSLYGPGNIVWKKARKSGQNEVSLGSICSPEYLTFPGPPATSATEQINLKRNVDFNFTSSALKKLGLAVTPSYVDSFTLSFSNTEVQEYSLEKLDVIESNLGPKCSAILQSQREKKNAYIVLSVFKADLDYKVNFKAGVEASLKNVILQELSTEFSLAVDAESGHIGRGLYYGVDLKPLF